MKKDFKVALELKRKKNQVKFEKMARKIVNFDEMKKKIVKFKNKW